MGKRISVYMADTMHEELQGIAARMNEENKGKPLPETNVNQLINHACREFVEKHKGE